MANILICDFTCPKPYTIWDTEHTPMGGTESTAAKVATRLAQKHSVTVAQHNCTQRQVIDNVVYTPLTDYSRTPDVVVVMRLPGMLKSLKELYPNAKFILWLQDLTSVQFGAHYENLLAVKPTIVCVSNYHLFQTRDVLKLYGFTGQFPTRSIYNPLNDYLVPNGKAYNPHKLVFFSSPHKGLEHTLEMFANVRRMDPRFELFIMNPGYLLAKTQRQDGVTVLGPLPQPQALEHVRDALCVFYINHVFPETFGCVYSEANAVGTPVLTHRIGASTEILDHPRELVDTKDVKAVVDRVVSWSNGDRPIVKPRKQFYLSNVIKEWEKLINE